MNAIIYPLQLGNERKVKVLNNVVSNFNKPFTTSKVIFQFSEFEGMYLNVNYNIIKRNF